jgi:phenylacetate-coenzyme A ligase PaaK-like adenylate-forming protein
LLNLFPGAPHLAFFQPVITKFVVGGCMLDTFGARVIPTERQLELAARIEFKAVVAIPSYLVHWLKTGIKRIEKGEIDKITSFRYAVVAGEPVSPAYKDHIRSLFAQLGSENVKIIEGYGSTEIKVAFYECAEGSRIHLHPKYFLWEMLDPKTLEPVGEEEKGILCFSHIDWRGTVFLRYYTGDLIEGGLTWERCPNCGLMWPRLLPPICRADKDFLKIKGTSVNLINLQSAVRDVEGVSTFQIVLTKMDIADPYSRDKLVIHVAVKEGADKKDVVDAIRVNVRKATEITPNEIIVKDAKEIERALFARTGLKADWFVDLRPSV